MNAFSTFHAFTHEQLAVSPLNVRQDQADAEDTAWLEDSIAGAGLIYPLVVHPLDTPADRPQARPGARSRSGAAGEASSGEEAKYGVLDGGRRFRAIGRLIDAGRLPAEWGIPCVLREDLTEAEMTELSLTAALLPRELHPWEVDAAILRAHEQGDSVAEIVARIGQPERWVRQRLRLGRLDPEIFAAYAAGEISSEEAQAYAATEDQDLQRAAWKHFQGEPRWAKRPQHIRAWLKIGDREEGKLLRFVGDDVYRAAGGTFELDLFADGPAESHWERGRVADPALLRQLVENKMGELRQRLRQRCGRSDLVFSASPPKSPLGTWDNSLSIEPEKKGPKVLLPEGDVVAVISIEEDGTHAVSWWWASRAAKRRAEAPSGLPGEDAGAAPPREPMVDGRPIAASAAMDPYTHYAQVARAHVREEHGLTADGLQIARTLRRECLRALLVSDASEGGTLGRDYLLWSQLRQELVSESLTATGARGLASEWSFRETPPSRDLVDPHLADSAAHTVWRQALERIAREPFITIAEPEDAFVAFVDALEPVKAIAAAVLAGLALARSANVAGWKLPAHDRLAAMAGGNDAALRQVWEPTERFIGLLPKLKRLELAEPFVGRQQTTEWAKLKDGEITAAVTGALRAAEGWVHPLLCFSRSAPGTLAAVFEEAGE